MTPTQPGRPRIPRRALAGAVLLLWIAGLGLLAQREWIRPMSDRLAEVALQVQPSAMFYVIDRHNTVVGAGSASVDTTVSGIVLRHNLIGRLIEGDTTSVNVNARTAYSRGMAFGSFGIEAGSVGRYSVLLGNRSSDSLLLVSRDVPGEQPHTVRFVAPDPLFLTASVGLPLVLLQRPRPGREMRVRVYDPWLQRPQLIPFRLAAESLFVVVDSAAFDPASQRWTMARRDTVRAWLATSDSTAFSAWVDRAGHIVEATDGRGMRATRTAYEIAYENWRLSRE